MVAVALTPASSAAGQAQPSKPAAKANPSASQAELSRRIQAAEASRATGNPEVIGEANRRVIALALRKMGHLRSTEHEYAQATELYRNSLTFEDAGDTRADLASAQRVAGLGLASRASDPFARPEASAFQRAHLTPQQRAAAEAEENQLRLVLGDSLNDLATSEAARNQFATALVHLQEAEKWNPATVGLARNLGYCAFKVNDYPTAIRGLARALEEQPQDAPVRAMLGMAYFGSNKYEDAAKTFEPLGERGMQDASVGYAWALSLTRIGDFQKAANVLGQFENSDLSPAASLLVGQLWTEMEYYDRAVAVFQKVLQRDPSTREAHFFEGLAYLKLGKFNEAAADFRAELALNPGDLDAKYTLGFIYLQQQNVDEALALFNEVLVAEPNYAKAQYQMGKIMMDRRQVDEAIPHLEAAARLTPDADYIHYELQIAYRKVSRIADADRELEIYKQLKAKEREEGTAPKQER